MDVARDIRQGELVEAELDAFISRRDTQRRTTEGERAAEETYEENVRRYHKRERRGMLWERLRYHEALIQSHCSTFELLIGRHRSEVARLETLLGISETKGAA